LISNALSVTRPVLNEKSDGEKLEILWQAFADAYSWRDEKSDGEKFEIMWQAFADAYSWRVEEAELLDSLRAKVANQRTEFEAMNQTLNKLDAKLIEIEARGRDLADRADEIEGDAGE